MIDSKRVDCYFTLVLTPRVSGKYIYSFNNSFLEAESKTVTAAPQWSDTITKINLPKHKHKRINTNTREQIQTQERDTNTMMKFKQTFCLNIFSGKPQVKYCFNTGDQNYKNVQGVSEKSVFFEICILSLRNVSKSDFIPKSS